MKRRDGWNPYGGRSDLQLLELYDKEFPNLWPFIVLLAVLYLGWRYTGWFFWISLTMLVAVTVVLIAGEPTTKRRELRQEMKRRMKQ